MLKSPIKIVDLSIFLLVPSVLVLCSLMNCCLVHIHVGLLHLGGFTLSLLCNIFLFWGKFLFSEVYFMWYWYSHSCYWKKLMFALYFFPIHSICSYYYVCSMFLINSIKFHHVFIHHANLCLSIESSVKSNVTIDMLGVKSSTLLFFHLFTLFFLYFMWITWTFLRVSFLFIYTILEYISLYTYIFSGCFKYYIIVVPAYSQFCFLWFHGIGIQKRKNTERSN